MKIDYHQLVNGNIVMDNGNLKVLQQHLTSLINLVLVDVRGQVFNPDADGIEIDYNFKVSRSAITRTYEAETNHDGQ